MRPLFHFPLCFIFNFQTLSRRYLLVEISISSYAISSKTTQISSNFLITWKKNIKMSGRKEIKLPRADWSIFHVSPLSYWVALLSLVSFSSFLVYFSIQLLPSSSTTPSLSSTYTAKAIQASN